MATELCGSKLIAPYFGSSLYVWTSVIAITLGSLAAGYFYGGKLSLKENKQRILLSILLIAALYMGFMPIISNLFSAIAIRMSLIPAVVVSSFVLLVPPMFLMGSASPLIISLQTKDSAESGRVSGLVYSISTLGGIIATFACGFYLIPAFGLNITLVSFAILLLISLLIILKKKVNSTLISVIIALIILGFKNAPLAKNCIYEKDGILGKVDVLDDTLSSFDLTDHGCIASEPVKRILLVNNVVQTEMDIESGISYSEYVSLLDGNIESTKNEKALVLGLGGGVTSNLLHKKGFDVTGVDLDERIIDISKKYFNLNIKVNTVCDDARHFINISNETYNLILIDIFKAEEQPVHVITSESLEKVKKMLSQNGKLIINWHGYSSGERGMGTHILLNTLKKAGFNCRFAAVSLVEDARNLVIFSSQNEVSPLNHEVKIDPPATSLINTDDHPVLEKYNALANQSWRKNYILYYYSGSKN